MLRQPVDAQNNPLVTTAGPGSWQAVQTDPTGGCGLVVANSAALPAPQPIASGLNQLLPSSEPPATIVSLPALSNNEPTTPGLPAADIGLMAPQITELLPNPLGTSNDSTDEYIELYNANDSPFDLTGFALQSGLTTLHSYLFPHGLSLQPHSFTTFYATQTKLTLSNSGSQVKLIDPLGNSITASDPYSTALDGQAWAFANGVWYWSTQPTPSAANIITQPTAKLPPGSKASSTAAKAKRSGSTKSATNAKKLKTVVPKTKSAAVTKPAAVPIHPWVLALAGGLALLYGVYEYRNDLANHLRKLGTNLGLGQRFGSQATRRRSDRTSE